MTVYRGPWCCLLCGDTLDHGRKFYSHLGEAHPEIIDRELARLARDRDVTRIVDVSLNPTETDGSRREIPINSK